MNSSQINIGKHTAVSEYNANYAWIFYGNKLLLKNYYNPFIFSIFACCKISKKMEIWKSIPNFEHYEASNLGNIRSIKFKVIRKNGREYTHKGFILSQHYDKDGYKYADLYVGKKLYRKKVHRLVYSAFYNINDDDFVVDHINNNREDNRIENLQLITNRDNLQKDAYRHRKHKLPLGVHKNINSSRYNATIRINNVTYFLGTFDRVCEAKKAYDEADGMFRKNGAIPDCIKRIRNKIVGESKVCSCCGIEKSLSEYYISKGRVQGKCKECFKKERNSHYKRKNKERKREWQRQSSIN